MKERFSSKIIDIEAQTGSLITPDQSQSIFSTSFPYYVEEKNPLLRGEKHALIITVLQVISAEHLLNDFYLMLKVGSHYYKGEPFQLGVNKKPKWYPQNTVISSSLISSPISRNGDMVLVSVGSREKPVQSNANIELCQKFIFWVSLHAELFDYVHVRSRSV